MIPLEEKIRLSITSNGIIMEHTNETKHVKVSLTDTIGPSADNIQTIKDSLTVLDSSTSDKICQVLDSNIFNTERFNKYANIIFHNRMCEIIFFINNTSADTVREICINLDSL